MSTELFPRNPETGEIIVPHFVGEVAGVFSVADTEAAAAHLIAVASEELAAQLCLLAERLSAMTPPELLGVLCEGWQAGGAIEPTLSLLERLAPRQTMRAVIAQHACRARPELFDQLLPFYQAIAGARRGGCTTSPPGAG